MRSVNLDVVYVLFSVEAKALGEFGCCIFL